MVALATGTTRQTWYLEGRLRSGLPVECIPIHAPRFQVGRRADLSLCLPEPTVSGLHAEIVADAEGLVVRDLGSANGSFLNGERIVGARRLREGDLVQFACTAFRLRSGVPERSHGTTRNTLSSADVAYVLCQFERLMLDKAVTPHFQPLVSLPDAKATHAFELLARSRMPGLTSARELFLAAAHVNQEAALSRLIREVGVELAGKLPKRAALFMNIHPLETLDDELLASLDWLRRLEPRRPMTIEIHESAVVRGDSMKSFRAELRTLDIQVAYDDFGAGQSRLHELLHEPPDYLKFDMGLLRNINAAPEHHQSLIAALVQTAERMGIRTVAEGIELPAEHETCCRFGFSLGQGYLYGAPASISNTVRKGRPAAARAQAAPKAAFAERD
jgi:EAL domain-containing protein (putative c-di-GMP-specific phosphodiesterase class I)